MFDILLLDDSRHTHTLYIHIYVFIYRVIIIIVIVRYGNRVYGLHGWTNSMVIPP